MSLLDVRELSVTYPHRSGPVYAVRGASVRLDAGEIVGLAGESGCGKTTLARAVLRLLPAGARVSGRILLDGRDVLALGWGALRAVRWAGASLVFQGAQHTLNPVHRIGAQVAEPMLVHRRATRRRAAVAAADLLARVGLPADWTARYPHQLSGGQRQRVMIAMALACSPRLVIADEATAAVDTVTQARLLRLLAGLVAEDRLGLLMIGHDLTALASVCHRLAVMYAGRVIEQGPADALLETPRHRYTRALVDAAGRFGDPAGRWNPRSLPGDPPDPARPAAGCAFVPRCPAATIECTTAPVDLRPDGPGRLTACLHPVDAPAESVPARSAPAGRVPVATTAGAGPLLSIEDMTVSYGGAPAVDRVSLYLEPGEFVALVGESGGGKTTLARAAVGLVRPAGGRVSLAGWAPRHSGADLRRLRRQVQLIPQDPGGALNPRHTAGHAVAEALRIHRLDHGPERVARALARVGLRPPERFADRRPVDLSGGQQARVAIAASLAVGPKVLIADEPVSGLDASARGEILALLLTLRDGEGLSVLLITHDLAVAWQVADRIVVMRHGRVVEGGPVERVAGAPAHPHTRELLDSARGRRKCDCPMTRGDG
jgi:oligopeptide/dipeptide ABC transporter ATP-binding protein